MSRHVISVRPQHKLRKAFAKWARGHKVRTVSAVDFGVPASLFPLIPEELLDGGLVDGQRWLPPESVRARPAQKAPPEKAAGADVGAAAAAPVEVENPTSATCEEVESEPELVPEHEPDPVPDPEPELPVETPAAAHETVDPPAERQRVEPCPHCGRDDFTTEHGRKIHIGRAHGGNGDAAALAPVDEAASGVRAPEGWAEV